MLQELVLVVTEVGSQVWLLLLTAAAVALTVFGLFGLISADDPILRRLAYGTSTRRDGDPAPAVRQAGDEALKKLDAYVTPKSDIERSQMRLRFARAGYRRPGAIRIYYLLRACLGLGSALGLALLAPLLMKEVQVEKVMALTLIAGMAGLYLPTLLVARRIQVRRQEIRDAFPDALDLLLVCVEAGQGLDAALSKVAAEIGQAYPALAEELLLVGLELRAGKSRTEVLRDLAARIGVDEVSAFVTVLIQSDQFGTSIGDALRVYASEMRSKRMLRAEEQANKLPVKLALGTIVCTIPPVLLILAGPSLIMAIRTLSKLVK